MSMKVVTLGSLPIVGVCIRTLLDREAQPDVCEGGHSRKSSNRCRV